MSAARIARPVAGSTWKLLLPVGSNTRRSVLSVWKFHPWAEPRSRWKASALAITAEATTQRIARVRAVSMFSGTSFSTCWALVLRSAHADDHRVSGVVGVEHGHDADAAGLHLGGGDAAADRHARGVGGAAVLDLHDRGVRRGVE